MYALFRLKWRLHPLSPFSYLLQRAKLATLSKSLTRNKIDKISLHVIGNGANGNPRSLILDYNDRLFMFNCGEGLQRILPDYGFKSSKIEHFFVTSNNWQNISGLSSLLLARYDAGNKELSITGPDKANIIKECIRFDTKLRRVKFNYLDDAFQFDQLHIKPITLDLNERSKSVAYMAQLSPQKGEINLEKCFQLRIPRQFVANLEKGIPISLESGQTILPSDVLNADEPEKRFFIFESNANSVEMLEANPQVSDFLSRCHCIVHFTNDRLLKDEKYRSFIKKLNSSYHLVITESNPSLCLYSAHRFQTQLNFIDAKLFPMLREKASIDDEPSKDNVKVISCPTGLNFHLRPHPHEESSLLTLDRIPSFDLKNRESSLIYKDGTEREGLIETLDLLHQKQLSQNHNTLANTSLLSSYPEFVFLGTASSVSLPIRNVSSILVNLSASESILLECGENTYGQLLRFYGQDKIGNVLKRIKAIFISHHHSDHHMGLVQMIERRHLFSGNRTMIILPLMVSKFLHSKTVSFSSLNNLNDKYNYAISRYFCDNTKRKFVRLYESLQDVQLIPVSHCTSSYGISLTTKSGFRFVYSGDTEPCDSLVAQGRNCDLLIHESTVEDGLVNFARTHFHSTMSEAINVGRRMNARFTILTHFSQRYGKLPFLATTADENGLQTVGLAFDNLQICPADFYRLPLMYDALKCMYSKHLETLEHKSELYSRKYGKVME